MSEKTIAYHVIDFPAERRDLLFVNDTTCRAVGDCDVRARVSVSRGVHRLAAAAWNATGGWGLRLSLQDPALGPILDGAAQIVTPALGFEKSRRFQASVK